MKSTQSISPLLSRIAAVTVGSLVLLALTLVLLRYPAGVILADGSDDGTVVVEFGPTERIARPISFTAPISGLAALELTGLEIITTDFGGGFIAVCSIGGVGCPADNCFGCDPAGRSWANTFWNGTAWEGYSVGAADTTVNAGAVEGWTYGTFDPPNFDPPMPAVPAPPLTAAVKALDWLADQQSETDGSYGAAGGSAEVLLTIGADGYPASAWQRSEDAPSLLHYLLVNSAGYANSGSAAAGKLAIGMAGAANCYPANAARPGAYFVEATGIYTGGFGAGGAGPQSWAMMGSAALSETIPSGAVDQLKSTINADGGWGWVAGSSDTNGTSLALQALVAAGESLSGTEVISGLAYLDAAQNSDGGFPYDPASLTTTESDANSTAYVVQALMATGQDPFTGTWLISDTHPISYLLSLQLADGSFEWQAGSGTNQLATEQAIPALLGRPYPLRINPNLETCPARFLPVITKN
jgi:hypothetical protein